MGSFTTLADIWKYYDVSDRKKFYSHDITMAINSLPKDNPDAECCRFEAIAFGFSENNKGKDWGIYYGPQFTFKKKDTGETVCVPDIKDIDQKMMDYWEERCGVVQNPLLKMRYTGLVLEFKKKVFGQEPDYNKIKLAHIKALVDVVDGDYCEHETVAFDYAERALYLSIGFRNKELQKQAVKSFFEAHQRLSSNDMHPGVWGRIFQSLIKHRKYYAEYETTLLNEQLQRFERIKELAFTEGEKTDRYAHVLSEQVDLLADYYQSIGEPQKAGLFLDTLLEAVKKSINARGGLWGQGMIQQMQQRYRKYGFDKKANQLFIDLRDLGEATLNELKPTVFTIPLDTNMINAFLDEALNGTNRDVLLYFLFQYLPKLDDEKRKLKERAEKAPMLDLVSTVTIDSSGNTISRVGIGQNADRQKLYFNMYENMRIIIPFMHLHITKMKENGKMTTESMMQLLEKSTLITDDHKEIVKRGFDAYMAEDYLVCCHLLVPQLEAAIRRLFALNGVNIMRAKKDPAEGNEYLSLDSLLGSDDSRSIMGEDLANYLRNVMTDQYGWNIRNQVSHGLLATESFNYGLADRLVHAFLMLGVFKKNDDELIEETGEVQVPTLK